MKCYPVKEKYVDTFLGRERALLNLIKRNSIQLDILLERIDVCDFSMRCIRFFKSSEYELKGNTIIYTNEITKEKVYCSLQNNCLCITSLKGFESFLKRYFKCCLIVDEEFDRFMWLSYGKTVKK